MSHNLFALRILYTLQATLPAFFPLFSVKYLPCTGHSRQTTWSLSFKSILSSLASFSVRGKASFQSPSLFTASINSLVIRHDKLN